jgi:anaphase-promoting complex subunit 6
MEESSPAVLERLRNTVADCLDKHLHSSAVFFADKLVTLSDGAAEDVFLLAQARAGGAHTHTRKHVIALLLAVLCSPDENERTWPQAYIHSGQHRRALALLRSESLVEAGGRFTHLAGVCLVATEQWDEALTVLGGERSERATTASRCERWLAHRGCLIAHADSPPALRCAARAAATRRLMAAWPPQPRWHCCAGACTPAWRTAPPRRAASRCDLLPRLPVRAGVFCAHGG